VLFLLMVTLIWLLSGVSLGDFLFEANLCVTDDIRVEGSKHVFDSAGALGPMATAAST